MDFIIATSTSIFIKFYMCRCVAYYRANKKLGTKDTYHQFTNVLKHLYDEKVMIRKIIQEFHGENGDDIDTFYNAMMNVRQVNISNLFRQIILMLVL